MRGKTIHILLADDSITIQKVVELTFSDGPYVVTSVSDGSRAIAAALQLKPDVVLADVNMPHLTGYQVCTQIKKELPGTPVLLMVGTFEHLDEVEVRHCRADGVVVKPFDSRVLITEVEQLVERAMERPSVGESPAMSATSHDGSGVRVFLCHASEDKPAIRALYKKFVAEGFRPWLDEEDLLPGEDWRHAITTQLRRTDAVVVCLSRQSVTKAGYVQKEIAVALDILAEQPEGSIFLIPLLIEDCELPARLAHLHAARVPLDEGFTRVCRALRRRAEMKRG